MGGRNKSLTSTSLIGGMIILIDDANLKTGFQSFQQTYLQNNFDSQILAKKSKDIIYQPKIVVTVDFFSGHLISDHLSGFELLSKDNFGFKN